MLPFTEYILKTLFVFDVLTYDTNSKCIIHSLIEKITVKVNYVLMVLRLKELNSFLFVFI